MYLITRLIILPKKKQIKFSKYSVMEIIQFIFISILLDAIKLFAFLKTIIKIFLKKIKFNCDFIINKILYKKCELHIKV